MISATSVPLREKQALAVSHVLAHRRAIVNYGMGTGKSRVVVEAWRQRRPQLTVIFAPKAVLVSGHWSREFQKWLEPSEAVAVGELWKHSVSWRAKKLREAGQPGRPRTVVVLGYQTLLSAEIVSALLDIRPGMLVYDECHRLKAPSGKQARHARKVEPTMPWIVGLTGTLMPHSPLDAWGVAHAICGPDVLGRSYVWFRNTYAQMGGFQGRQVLGFRNLDELAKRLSTVTIRATREEMLDLPPATHIEIPVDLGPEGRRVYRSMRDSFIAEVKSGLITAQNGIVKLLRLRQITGGMMLPDGADRWVTFDTAKEEALDGLLEAALAEGERVVVFCQFKAELELVRRVTGRREARYCEVSGDENSLSSWDSGVLGVQIASGSEGIDLTMASIAVFLNPGLSLGVYEQALARLHRPGQRKAVTYYHIVARGTVDLRVYRALSERRDVIRSVFDHLEEL